MNDWQNRFSRTSLLLGDEALQKLKQQRVLVVGVGGVGGHAAENIARCGVGEMTLVDGDSIDISNCNRQIIATGSVVGNPKAAVLAERCMDINPDGKFTAVTEFLQSPEDIEKLLAADFDFAVDAIDDVPVKVELIRQLKMRNIPFISAMGAGGKLDPGQFRIADISKTNGCPLARVMRGKLKEIGITKGVTVVFSPEAPDRTFAAKNIGSISYMPAIAGCFCAAHAIKCLTAENCK